MHYRGMCCTGMYLHHRGLSCICKCIQYIGLCCSWMWPHGPELHLDVSALQKLMLHWQVSSRQGPEQHLHIYIQRHVLLLDVSTPQRWAAQMSTWAVSGHVHNKEACAYLDVSTVTPQGPKLHLDMSLLQRPASWLVYYQGPELHLDLVGQQEPLLLLDVSTLKRRELHLDYLGYWRLCCCWTCLHYRGLCCVWSCLHTEAWAASGCV